MQVNEPPRTIAVLGARTVMEPLLQMSLDVLVACIRMLATQVLAHQLESDVVEVDCGSEGTFRVRRLERHVEIVSVQRPPVCSASKRRLCYRADR